MGGHVGGEEAHEAQPLFETEVSKGTKLAYRVYAVTVLIGICSIWVYRSMNIPTAEEKGRWAWIGMFMAELWFGFYWIITQSVRWNVTHRYTFKDRLINRYGDKLPAVDIFVCTADPTMEPPTMVISTVLSVMSYNYPPDKLSVYLSDDGGSEFTFHALLEASRFSKHWIPFCKKFSVEPRSPLAYFAQNSKPEDPKVAKEWLAIKKLYEEMKCRIESAIEKGCISKDIRDQHKGFSEWNSEVTKQDHQPIVQILIDRRNPDAVDDDGHQLPTLVYVAREKRPQFPHNFKAGSMNSLIRVSSEISNAPIILNVDCDMYSNNSDAIKEALCFFMDKERGHMISYVQYPQSYDNITKNDIYSNMGLVYGCLVEDIITGLTIQCRGWKPVYYNPERTAFLGVAPNTLDISLVQHKRWCEGMFQIFLSKYCPFTYGYDKIKLGAQTGYCLYLLWAPNSIALLYYLIIPSICLLHGIPLFPEVSSLWFLPFAYVYAARNACGIAEALACGDTLKAWWNSQRMWYFRRTTSYLFAFIDTITRQLGFSQSAFSITAKVVDDDVLERYEEGTMEFGTSSVMFTIIATLSLLNFFGFTAGILKIIWGYGFAEGLTVQIGLCLVVVVINLPVYQALFLRDDNGRIPSSVVFKSLVLASLACLIPVY
ncbi:hypothetical protein RHMOL_Rhmol06G0313900 [Rhododendron molle]|uniref:Uncharacterized protein n=1 Tax=Rhododendron molle TaxID=49168 RepID=A0ACC0NJ32_RHOML|nr:hypothetical protein RHMOL_Rhmol06G0313900 [Rhododendron molle]